MSLMKLLSVSKSFAGGRSQSGRYKMAEQGLLPKFAPMGRAVSLAPLRNPDETSSRPEANDTRPIPLEAPQTSAAVEVAAEPVVPRARASVCVNANDSPPNWFRLGNKPLVNRLASRPKPAAPLQTELSLDAVKPVRNDLSDSDLQIVSAQPKINSDASKAPPPRWLKPELTGLAWSRLTARLFNSERVRA